MSSVLRPSQPRPHISETWILSRLGRAKGQFPVEPLPRVKCVAAHPKVSAFFMIKNNKDGGIVMRPVIATGIFGTLGIALALEVMSVLTTFTTMQHLATYSGWPSHAPF